MSSANNPAGKYLNDNWTPDVDPLNYTQMRDELVTLAQNCHPPFAVAIYGGWGGGKTSLLRAVMNQLGGALVQLSADEALLENATELDEVEKQIWDGLQETLIENNKRPCVWFNPWQHQFEGHPLVALLQEIRQQYTTKLKMLETGKKMGYMALKAGLRLFDDLISASKVLTGYDIAFLKNSLSTDKAQADKAAFEKNRFDTPLDSQRFQIHFEAAIAHLTSDGELPDQSRRLVIFIDDLDRCESAQVLKLLESIKLYLSTRKCIFFLGLDREHIEKALCAAGSGMKDGFQARSYLQKLFQIAVHLPKTNQLDMFIEKLLHQLGLELFGLENEEKLKTFAQFLGEILEANPRRVKNFLNQLFFYGRTYQKRLGRPPDPNVLALLLALRNYYPDVYTALEEAPDRKDRIIAGLRHNRPKSAENGLGAMVARETFLPQFEEKSPEDDELSFDAIEKGHYADARGFFEVLYRFKNQFINTFEPMETKTLREYLAP